MLPQRWLVPLGKGSTKNDIELMYMLRGLAKHHPEAEPLVIGEKPIWYKGEHIPYTDDVTGVKENNIRLKVLHYCKLNPCTQFVFSNDDHFLLAPFSGRNYYQHTLAYFSGLCFGGIYKQCIDNTIRVCGAQFPYYDVHTPIIIDSDLFIQHLSDEWRKTSCCVMKTIYAYRSQLVGTPYVDAGLKSPHDIHEIRALLDGRIMFTINDPVAMTQGLMRYFAETYPVKSRWE